MSMLLSLYAQPLYILAQYVIYKIMIFGLVTLSYANTAIDSRYLYSVVLSSSSPIIVFNCKCLISPCSELDSENVEDELIRTYYFNDSPF